jgi:hypothetical protein
VMPLCSMWVAFRSWTQRRLQVFDTLQSRKPE